MTVRAKFQVLDIKHHHVPSYSNTDPVRCHIEIRAVPVNSASGPGNESWSQATPSGELKMTITNPFAAEAFEVGGLYLVDFTPVEK